jgi:diaminopimelate epimerase
MRLRFTKMQGLGNDFVVLDGIRQELALTRETLRSLADRRFGIGCDQVLTITRATVPGADFRYRIFNADGDEAEQCGNGARCVVRFLHDEGLTAKPDIHLETMAGIISPRLEPDGQVTVEMGIPRFDPEEIPFAVEKEALVYPLRLGSEAIEISALSMGNPHAVQIVADAARAPVATQGPLIEIHPAFPNRVNAGFMQIESRNHIRLRVYERGVGETLACGTGACAAVVAGVRRGLLDHAVRVTTRGGDLHIRWAGCGEPVVMTGAATSVFHGEIEISRLR